MSERRTLRPYAFASGVLLGLSPAALLLAGEIHGASLPSSLAHQAVVGATLLSGLLAGVLLPRLLGAGRIFASLFAGGMLVLATPVLLRAPAATLATLVITVGTLARLWNVDGGLVSMGVRRAPLHPRRVEGAAVGALLCLFALNQVGGGASVVSRAGPALSMLLLVLLALRWVRWARSAHPLRAGTAVAVIAVAAVLGGLAWGRWHLVLQVGALASCALLLVVPRDAEGARRGAGVLDLFVGHLERMFVGTFAGLCLIGALLLSLPQSAASGQPIALIDAVFTSVSAVCVTGLVVLDTPVDFSGFGQVVILLLIQLGGLGIMTFSTAILRVLGRRMSLRHEGAVARLMSTEDRGKLFGAAQRILVLTFVCEALGAVVLALAFAADGASPGRAAWLGLFTAVSAFCNAGFALESTSLVAHAESPLVLHTVALLIVLGGLSPAAVFALPDIVRRRSRPVAAQIKLALLSSVALLLVGFFVILALEWDNTLAGMSGLDRIHNAWFQSVTLRTAGFNSIDIAAVRPATLSLMILWMFIGGSPGGTAGGIKTTTAAVLLVSVVQAVRGHWNLDLFGRRIADRTRHKAAVTITLAVAVAFSALFVLQITQRMPTVTAIFEVVSALGTVGLSIGGTGALDEIGKLVIVACMFVGRVGGITLLMFLGHRREVQDREHPVEEIDVG